MEHTPVLISEVIDYLVTINGNFVDATVGLGGHARAILDKTSPKGKLIGLDRDKIVLAQAGKNLAKYGGRVELICANFNEIGLLLRNVPYRIDGIFFDLGTSNYQLLSDTRGFSFQSDAPLDMRMDPDRDRLTAADVVSKFTQKELIEVLRTGEEKYAFQIARKIIQIRQKQPIKTTYQLVEAIRQALPPQVRHSQKLHFATDTFRAIRMHVNHELEDLISALKQAKQILPEGGRCAVISFHSLEDRIVKNFFKDEETWEIVTKKPVMASNEEIAENPRSRSAKLRVAIRK